MPQNTITEFRGRNKFSKKDRYKRKKTRSSSPPKKIGNVKTPGKNLCTYCCPELFCSLRRRLNVKENIKEVSIHKSVEKSIEI